MCLGGGEQSPATTPLKYRVAERGTKGGGPRQKYVYGSVLARPEPPQLHPIHLSESSKGSSRGLGSFSLQGPGGGNREKGQGRDGRRPKRRGEDQNAYGDGMGRRLAPKVRKWGREESATCHLRLGL